MPKLSVAITTFNNAATLESCLESVRWADEIVVLDSFSTDRTVEIAKAYNCRLAQHEFLGYGPQKQSAIEKTENRWVLLLDADEMLTNELQKEIAYLLSREPKYNAYEIARLEQLFWRMNNPYCRLNFYLRLFDKEKTAMSHHAVHADPKTSGSTGRLRHPFYHFGEINIHVKEEKINAYSTGLVEEKVAKGKKGNIWMLLLYPPFAFLQSYFFKRNFLNGSAGFIGSVINAHYAFLKYAKVHEWHKRAKYGRSLLPSGAPLQTGNPTVPK